jgi:hypothetical protein
MAVEYGDGWGVYAYNGIRLPEKYGKERAEDWKPQWVLEERNSDLRRVLVQGIGAQTCFSSLGATKRDHWREYELYSNPNLSFQILHMTCPSTQEKHYLFVPTEISKAEEAICYVNHGIHPDQFAMQT